jgi:hypothetical protein
LPNGIEIPRRMTGMPREGNDPQRIVIGAPNFDSRRLLGKVHRRMKHTALVFAACENFQTIAARGVGYPRQWMDIP